MDSSYTISENEYREFLEFKKMKEEGKLNFKPNNKSKSILPYSDLGSAEKQIIDSELKKTFSKETIQIINDEHRLSFVKYGAEYPLNMRNTLCFIISGSVALYYLDSFVNFQNKGNWLGVLKLAKAFSDLDYNPSVYSTPAQLRTFSDETLLAVLDITNMESSLKADATFSKVLFRSLFQIITGNNAMTYLVKHKRKVSLLAIYVMMDYDQIDSTIWSPNNTQIAKELGWTLTDVSRGIKKLIDEEIITEIPDASKNKSFSFSKNARDKLLNISEVTEEIYHQLKRILRP